MRDRKKGLVFQSQKAQKSKNKRRFALAFLCFSLILGAVSFLMLLRAYDFDLSGMVRTTESTKDSSSLITESTTEPITGGAVFLIVHTSDDGKTVRGIFYVAADMSTRSVGVLPLAPDKDVAPDGIKTTLAKVYLSGGAEELKKAAATVAGFAADKYVVMTDTGLINCLKTLGDLKIKMTKAIHCKTENLVLELPAGVQLLAPDTVLRLIKYNLTAYGFEEAAKENAALLAAAIKTYCEPKLASRSEEVFSALINSVKSDISALDFAGAKSAVDAFALSADKGPIAVVNNLTPPVTKESSS